MAEKVQVTTTDEVQCMPGSGYSVWWRIQTKIKLQYINVSNPDLFVIAMDKTNSQKDDYYAFGYTTKFIINALWTK